MANPCMQLSLIVKLIYIFN